MTDIRVPVDYFGRPEVEALSSDGLRVHLAATAWSAGYGKDGYLAVTALPRLHPDGRREDLAAELVGAGFWEAVDGGWRLTDYFPAQSSAAEVEAYKAANRERSRKYRARVAALVDEASNAPHVTRDVTRDVTDDERAFVGKARQGKALVTGTELEVGEPEPEPRDEPPTFRVVDPPADGRSRWSPRKVAPCVCCGEGARLALDGDPTHPACRVDVPIDLPERVSA